MKKKQKRELNMAVREYQSVLKAYSPDSDSFSVVELAKLKIADLVIGFYDIPASVRNVPSPIPKESRKSVYQRYLASSHWKELRKVALIRDGYFCQHCGSPDFLRVHHKRYRTNLTKCVPEDLITLCEDCHSKEHARLDKERKENQA